MAAATETELKIVLPGEALHRLRTHPLIRAHSQGRAQTRQLHSIYYDTPDLLLRRNGASLRIRHQGQRRIQNVKTQTGHGGGVMRRGEWECDLAGDDLDLAWLAETGVAGLLADADICAALKPLFTTRFRRTSFVLADGDDHWRVELTLDSGTVEADGQATELYEAELELISGTAADLYRLAQELVTGLPARISTMSKSERGYALVTGTGPAPVKADNPKLTRKMSTAAAFQEIARACLGHLLANEPALRETRHPEAVHQMRVAMRRFRSALTLFKPLVDTTHGKDVRAEVKWAAGALGDARDLDVFLAEVFAPAAEAMPGDAGLTALRAEFEKRRDAAYARALEAIRSPRFTAMVLGAAEWVEDGDWLRPNGPAARERLERPVKDTAADILRAHERKTLKRGRHFATLDPEARHRVRIEVKKLRYAMDFFQSLYGGKKVKPFSRALAALQDHLGAMNDATIAHGLLHDLVGESVRANQGTKGRERAFAAGLVAGWHEARAAAELDAATTAWKAFKKAKPFWR